jgi:hypothetical protein
MNKGREAVSKTGKLTPRFHQPHQLLPRSQLIVVNTPSAWIVACDIDGKGSTADSDAMFQQRDT